ncbi:MAG: phosphoesterase, partial [bacterium]
MVILPVGACALALVPGRAADTLRIGPADDGGAVAATRQLLHPAGRGVVYAGGHPYDLAVAPDGKTVYVKGDWTVLAIDAATWTLRQQLGYNGPDGASPHGIAASADGRKVFVTDTLARLFEALVGNDGRLTWGREISLAGKGKAWTSHPCGLALSPDGLTAWVCLSMHNTLGVVDLAAGPLVAEIPVGVAPYAVAVAPDGRTAWVSNWGGRRPRKGERTAKSAGTDVFVDARGVAATGTVSVVDLARRKVAAEIPVGLHPAGMALSADGARLYVACANADTVAVLDTAARRVVESILVRPDPALPYGSAPNAVALSPDGATLYAACGGNNAVAVVALSRSGSARVLG